VAARVKYSAAMISPHQPRSWISPLALASLLLAGCGSDQGLPVTGGDGAADGGGADVAIDAATSEGGGTAEAALPSLPDARADQTAPTDLADAQPSPVGMSCVLNSDCPAPLACTFGRCHVQCVQTRDCAPGQRCVKSASGQVCLLEQEARCPTGTSCPSPLVCASDQRCYNECVADRDCPPGQACAGRLCVEATGSMGGPDAGTSDASMLWGLSRGTNSYTVTAVATVSDGCMLGVEALRGMTLPVTYDEATQLISIGNIKGSPPMPSLGSGKVSENRATLVRDNQSGDPGSCYWHQKDVGFLELVYHDKFTVDVVEDEDMFAAGCTGADAPPPGGKCTSSFRLTLQKP
jgi:hypothetical protein